MNYQRHFEEGWQNTLKFIGPAILLTLVQLVLITISFGILAPVLTAGYTNSLLQAQREGRTPEMGDLFSHMRLFFPLLIFGLCLVVVISIGLMLLVLPGMAVTALVCFGLLYMVPLMVDQELGVIESVKESWRMSVEKPITDQIIIAVVYAGIMSLGGSFFITFLFAQPLATFILLSFYDRRLEDAGLLIVEEIEEEVEEEPVQAQAPPPPLEPEMNQDQPDQKKDGS